MPRQKDALTQAEFEDLISARIESLKRSGRLPPLEQVQAALQNVYQRIESPEGKKVVVTVEANREGRKPAPSE